MDKYLFCLIVVIVSILYFIFGAIMGSIGVEMKEDLDDHATTMTLLALMFGYIACSIIAIIVLSISLKGVF